MSLRQRIAEWYRSDLDTMPEPASPPVGMDECLRRDGTTRARFFEAVIEEYDPTERELAFMAICAPEWARGRLRYLLQQKRGDR